MKKVIILLVILLLLGGAGFGGWWFYIKSQDAAAAEEEQKKSHKQPGTVRMSPLSIPVIGTQKTEMFITLMVTLEVESQDLVMDVQHQMPRLVDAFLITLYGSLNEGDMLNGRLVNLIQVKEKLYKAAVKVLGPNIVREVLVQTVTRRML